MVISVMGLGTHLSHGVNFQMNNKTNLFDLVVMLNADVDEAVDVKAGFPAMSF